jgi:hypothetical protein
MLKRNISFNEELHRYTDEDNNIYTSVTTLIGIYTPVFNKDFWAGYKADQAGITKKEVLNNWKDITEEACIKGTKEHKLLEDSINNSINAYKSKEQLLITAANRLTGSQFTNVNIDILAQSNLAKKYPDIFKYLENKIRQGYKLFVEKRTYTYEHLVAGTIDCLLVKGKQFIIVDWKTNKKELHFKAGYYKKVNGIESSTWVDTNECMLGPLKHLQHCKGVIYTMQLSLYAYILELWGLECIGLVLYHIREGLPPKAYNIIYDKISSELLLIHHKNVSRSTQTFKSTSTIPIKFGIT